MNHIDWRWLVVAVIVVVLFAGQFVGPLLDRLQTRPPPAMPASEQPHSAPPPPSAPLTTDEQAPAAEQASAAAPLFSPVAAPPARTQPAAFPDGIPTHLLHFDRAALEQLSGGDRITVELPEMGLLDVDLHTVEPLTPQIMSLRGHVEGDRRFSLVLTVDERLVFGTLGTEQGVFNLRGSGTRLEIARARDLARLADHSEPDYVVPEHPPATRQPRSRVGEDERENE